MAPLPPTTIQPCRVAPRPIHTTSNKDSPHQWHPSLATPTTRNQLVTMRLLESTTYKPQNYYRHCLEQQKKKILISRCCTVEYLYQVVDYGGFQRDVVSYAMTHLLDRYLNTRSDRAIRALTDRNHYQLVALTCLYMAVKLLEPNNIGVESLVPLTNHVYGVQDFLQMESHILAALDWKVAHGPTPLAFVQHLLLLLPRNNSKLASALYPHIQYQLELAASDYDLCSSHQPSELAIAGIWNALEAIDVSVFSTHEKTRYRKAIEEALGTTRPWTEDAKRLHKIQSTLRELMLGAYTWCTSSNSSSSSSCAGESTEQGGKDTTTTTVGQTSGETVSSISGGSSNDALNKSESAPSIIQNTQQGGESSAQSDAAPRTPPPSSKKHNNNNAKPSRPSITSALHVHKEQEAEEEEQLLVLHNNKQKSSSPKQKDQSSPSHESINDVSEVEWFLYAS